MSADLQATILLEHCKALRLPGLARSYSALARQVRDESWSFESFLQELLESELLTVLSPTSAMCRWRTATTCRESMVTRCFSPLAARTRI